MYLKKKQTILLEQHYQTAPYHPDIHVYYRSYPKKKKYITDHDDFWRLNWGIGGKNIWVV